MIGMKRLLFIAFILLIPHAYGVTGVGFGVHAGRLNNYKYDLLSDSLSRAASVFGWGKSEFENDLTMIGAHIDIATLRVIEIFGYIDYAWKKTVLAPGFDFRLSDFSYGMGIKKSLLPSVMKPYIGAGVGIHQTAYSFESAMSPTDRAILVAIIPDNQANIGYYLNGGIELNFPLFPFKPYGEYKYNWITTRENLTKFGTISIGVTLKL